MYLLHLSVTIVCYHTEVTRRLLDALRIYAVNLSVNIPRYIP